MWLALVPFILIAYGYLGWMIWAMFECKYKKDGYVYYRNGSLLVYVCFWPIVVLKNIVKAFIRLWTQY